MFRSATALAILGLVAFASVQLTAASMSRAEVPEPLRPWVDWVLRDTESLRCPTRIGSTDELVCSWPARLSLEVAATGGQFRQDWFLDAESWVRLPGDDRSTPVDVEVDGTPVPVSFANGHPAVFLTAGSHRVTGGFRWPSIPESLTLPPETGLVDVTIAGKPLRTINRDGEGRLWLQQVAADGPSEELLSLDIHRRVTDEIPLILTTRIELRVGGRSRESRLARPLPPGFVPMSLVSPLPARIDADGHLRVQLRAGSWTIELTARSVGPVTAITVPEPDGPWESSEIWVYEALPSLRVADVEGVAAIDPQQTTIPEDWRSFPTYRLQPGDTLKFVERRRGDSEPSPDQLILNRTWWLDFDGGGYTIQDQMNGSVRHSWRLEMNAPTVLGHVALDGQDQLITRLAAQGPIGVEVRRGSVDLAAESRLETDSRRLPAVGWNHDFDRVSGVLHLPPGWRLLAASGVDDAPGSWLRRWSLLDLFLVLVTTLAFARLWDRRVGAVALVTLVLSFTERDAPQWSWLVFLAAEALHRVWPAGRTQMAIRVARLVAAVVVVMIAANFAIAQCRAGLYPALELPVDDAWRQQIQPMQTGWNQETPVPTDLSVDYGVSSVPNEQLAVQQEAPAPRAKAERSFKSKSQLYSQKALDNVMVFDPKAVVQTGPGVPTWKWSSLRLQWSGPVDAQQEIRLWLLPPWATRLLSFTRVGLLALLLALALRGLAASLRTSPAMAAMLLVACLPCGGVQAADLPSPELLDQLRTRLIERPACHPNCASPGRLGVDAKPSTLLLRLELVATDPTAVPLPGNLTTWTPTTALIDGNAATALGRDSSGTLWLRLPAGTHQLQLLGPLPDQDSVAVPLPLRPTRVEVTVDGWSVEGIDENGRAGESIELRRTRRAIPTADEDPAAAVVLPSFLRVEREIVLGLQWQVNTRVVRMTPPGSPIVTAVPLLTGESVTTAEVRVANGNAVLNLGPQTTSLEWTSVLEQRDRLDLVAPTDVAWVEEWRLSASPVWHVDLEGIPVIHHADPGAALLPVWRPWPGERVAIAVTRPSAVAGQTLTIDRSDLNVSPGLRSTDVTLEVDLRGSRGDQHTILLPEGAALRRVMVNGRSEPLRLEDRRLVLTIRPGANRFEVSWREPHGMGTVFRTEEVDLGLASVSARTRLSVPSSRWLLWTHGPRLGPAVLYWGVLLVMALLSIALGRIDRTPLRAHHWFLLGVGLTQVSVWLWAFIAGWFLALGYRRERSGVRPAIYDLDQLMLALWSVIAALLLVAALKEGLLGQPDMQIAGNDSTSSSLNWFADRAEPVLPRPRVLSLPMWVYRVAMLTWALWLASALIQWLRWGWARFSEGGVWRPLAINWRFWRWRKLDRGATDTTG